MSSDTFLNGTKPILDFFRLRRLMRLTWFDFLEGFRGIIKLFEVNRVFESAAFFLQSLECLKFLLLSFEFTEAGFDLVQNFADFSRLPSLSFIIFKLSSRRST